VAEISRKWFRLRDSYGVEVAPGQNDIVIQAVTVAIDMMPDLESAEWNIIVASWASFD